MCYIVHCGGISEDNKEENKNVNGKRIIELRICAKCRQTP